VRHVNGVVQFQSNSVSVEDSRQLEVVQAMVGAELVIVSCTIVLLGDVTSDSVVYQLDNTSVVCCWVM
jgi:hypothetical protein